MPEFGIRSDSVNVEQVMEQIRARIREKRGVDYTEQEIRELAAVKLEKMLDARGLHTDLLEQFQTTQRWIDTPEMTTDAIAASKLFESHRAPVRFIRRLLRPILKLFINPLLLAQAVQRETARQARDQLYYELLHNLVIEATRLGIDTKNLKMRVESLSARLEFSERRVRALEGVVVYKADEQPAPTVVQTERPRDSQRDSPREAPRPFVPTPPPQPPPSEPTAAGPGPAAAGEGPGQRSRRRRRRRGRRGGRPPATTMMGGSPPGPSSGASPADEGDSADESHPEPPPPSSGSGGPDDHQ